MLFDGDAMTVKWFVHNVIAHPLLVLCPPLGWRLHDLTAPPDTATSDIDDSGGMSLESDRPNGRD